MFTRELILKGVAGLAVVGGGAGGIAVCYQKGYFSEIEGDELIKKVGLDCTDQNNCSIAASSVLNIDWDGNKEEGYTSKSGSGKIKMEKDIEEYRGKFRFSIDSESVTLNKSNNSSPKTLEQFEIYEITEEGGKYYLSRKKKAGVEIERRLGLSTIQCTLPENNDPKECTDLDGEKIKAINFEGKSETNLPTLETGRKVKLTITKINDPNNHHFPYGYKFSLGSQESDSTITIGSEKTLPLKTNGNLELRIKRSDGGGRLTLEEAWTPSILGDKVGINCSAESECTVGDGKIQVKQESNSSDSLTKSSGSGKIKVYKDETHNKGFRFSIEDGNINLSGSNSISGLMEFDSYEIKEEEGKWYLSRREKAIEAKRRRLGLPSGDANCGLPTNEDDKECPLNSVEKIKGIKFVGKTNENITITDNSFENVKLKISKTKANNNSDFPMGYRFVLLSNKDIIFSNGPSPSTIKANTNTEFKIKKEGAGDNISLSLESAWGPESLGKKINLTCTSQDKKCSLGNTINVQLEINKPVTDLKVTSPNSKKISYQENVDGYNQGIKFTLDEEVAVTGGTTSQVPPDKIEKGDNGSISYEIKEITQGSDTKWYLVKK